jgi:UDP-N-acetylglucosamine 2-epimerase (non-hydrolysing)
LSDRKLNILAVCGTRPDTVKMAPVVLEILKHPEANLTLAVTGQHREMLEQVVRIFNLKPDYDLDIMSAKQTLAQITSRVLEGLQRIIEETKPDIILAQGDTSTTFTASLASFYNRIPFGHIEAGLRTDNKYDPFPEEMNRRLTGMLADFHFAPTTQAEENLLKEGVNPGLIFVTGNTGIDALLSVASQDFNFDDKKINDAIKSEKMILVTAHRRENWGEPMHRICKAIKYIAQNNPQFQILFAVHKNPIVREVVFPELEGVDRINLIEPPDYVPFVHLMKHAYIILTDSGGIQEEAPSLGKPVLVMRETTERPEGIAAGSSLLVGTNFDLITTKAQELIDSKQAYSKMSQVKNPYGDGNASEKIWKIIRQNLIDSRK